MPRAELGVRSSPVQFRPARQQHPAQRLEGLGSESPSHRGDAVRAKVGFVDPDPRVGAGRHHYPCLDLRPGTRDTAPIAGATASHNPMVTTIEVP